MRSHAVPMSFASSTIRPAPCVEPARRTREGEGDQQAEEPEHRAFHGAETLAAPCRVASACRCRGGGPARCMPSRARNRNAGEQTAAQGSEMSCAPGRRKPEAGAHGPVPGRGDRSVCAVGDMLLRMSGGDDPRILAAAREVPVSQSRGLHRSGRTPHSRRVVRRSSPAARSGGSLASSRSAPPSRCGPPQAAAGASPAPSPPCPKRPAPPAAIAPPTPGGSPAPASPPPRRARSAPPREAAGT